MTLLSFNGHFQDVVAKRTIVVTVAAAGLVLATGAAMGPVPGPMTAILVIAGLAGLGYAGRRSLR